MSLHKLLRDYIMVVNMFFLFLSLSDYITPNGVRNRTPTTRIRPELYLRAISEQVGNKI